MVCSPLTGWKFSQFLAFAKIEPRTKNYMVCKWQGHTHKVGWTTLKHSVACDGPTFSVDMMVPDLQQRVEGGREGGREVLTDVGLALWSTGTWERGERTNNNNYSMRTFRQSHDALTISINCCNNDVFDRQSRMITNAKKHTNLCL